MHERFHKVFTMQFVGLTKRTKHLEESAIEPLNRIPSWMVWSSMHLLYKLTEFSYGVPLKVRALIAKKSLWEAVVHYEIISKTFCDSTGALVWSWYGYCVLCEVIGNDQYILCVGPIGLQG